MNETYRNVYFENEYVFTHASYIPSTCTNITL